MLPHPIRADRLAGNDRAARTYCSIALALRSVGVIRPLLGGGTDTPLGDCSLGCPSLYCLECRLCEKKEVCP